MGFTDKQLLLIRSWAFVVEECAELLNSIAGSRRSWLTSFVKYNIHVPVVSHLKKNYMKTLNWGKIFQYQPKTLTRYTGTQYKKESHIPALKKQIKKIMSTSYVMPKIFIILNM